MRNKVAPEGQVYVCTVCGKFSKDKYGDQKIDPWWDESCMLHCILIYENSVVKDDQGNVISVNFVEQK